MNEHLWITNVFLIAIGTGSSETISGKSVLSFHIPVHRYNKMVIVSSNIYHKIFIPE